MEEKQGLGGGVVRVGRVAVKRKGSPEFILDMLSLR